MNPSHNEQQVQPMSIFEPKQISSNKRRLLLEQCCQFDYADGVFFKPDILCVLFIGACRQQSPTNCQMCKLVLAIVSQVLEEIDLPLKATISLLFSSNANLETHFKGAYDISMLSAKGWLSTAAIELHCINCGAAEHPSAPSPSIMRTTAAEFSASKKTNPPK